MWAWRCRDVHEDSVRRWGYVSTDQRKPSNRPTTEGVHRQDRHVGLHFLLVNDKVRNLARNAVIQ